VIQQCIECGDDDTAMHAIEMFIEAIDRCVAVYCIAVGCTVLQQWVAVVCSGFDIAMHAY